MFQWRRFAFFEKKLVTEDKKGSEAHPAFSKLDVTSTSKGNGKIVVGDDEGFITIMARDFSVSQFPAYQTKVSHLKMMVKRNILLTIGEDEIGSPTLKVWNLDKADKLGVPICARTVKLAQGKGGIPTVVICMAALEDLSQVAVGLGNGSVVLVRGNDISRDRFTKTRVLPPEEPTVVTGLGWVMLQNNPILFVVTLDAIITYSTKHKDYKDVLDIQGCDLGTCVMSNKGDLVLGRKEAVYFYEAEGRGPCYAFQGDKKLLFWFRSYLGIVFRDQDGSNKPDSLNIYDLENKFIAFSGSFPDVRNITDEWGSIFVFCGGGKVFQLEERDMERKLDMLFKKNLYPVAISLAKSTSNYELADLYRKYGDHLYSKGDYERAIGQYLRTIGKLEPSYVIRKFLDAQRINSLTLYLQALHSEGVANADHTTLLLNCYTKLNNQTKLKEFIETEDVNFDVEAAIKVCRAAQQFEHALYLARHYNEHDWFLKIQLEDVGSQKLTSKQKDEARWFFEKAGGGTVTASETRPLIEQMNEEMIPKMTVEEIDLLVKKLEKKGVNGRVTLQEFDRDLEAALKVTDGYVDALAYIQTLDFAEAERNLKKYGNTLVTKLPRQTTQVLMKLCTDYVAEGGNAVPELDLDPLPLEGDDDEPGPEDLRAALFGTSSPRESRPSAMAPVRTGGGGLQAQPDEFIHIYVEQQPWLIVFLEYIVREQVNTSPRIYSTLLELYLRDDMVLTAAVAAEMDSVPPLDKALAMLGNPQANYDLEEALVLCKLHDFKPGTLLIYERLSLYDEMLHFYMEGNDYQNILRVCHKYGDQDPNLWVKVLSYFSSRTDARAEIGEVLQSIDRNNLMPPLLVVQILAQNPSATLATVKEYITRQIQDEKEMALKDQRQINKFSEETAQKRTQIEELRTSGMIFQQMKCMACMSPLDLPSIHFLCMHSFHQRCLGDSEAECPVCAPENINVLRAKESLEEQANEHEVFFKRLEGSPDGFSVVSEYFGRGIFSKVTLTDKAAGGPSYEANERDRLMR